jgi:excinuclease ABC subunit C
MAPDHVRETVRRLPSGPGVYIMRSRTGEVIYVGKANSLRDRVRSYFAPATGEAVPKVRRIVAEVDRIEWQETGSELGALLLESRLIKQFGPRYNSQGRGWRSFVFIRVEAADPFPRVTATRRPVNDGSAYLGPFASTRTVEAALDLLHRLFPLRTCDEPIGLFRDRRPCVRGQVGRCGAPCAGLVSVREYGHVVEAALRFLRGEGNDLVSRLEADMAAASERLEFERAARLRDDLELARGLVQRQELLREALGRRSAAAVVEGAPGTAQLFLIEGGLLAGQSVILAAGRGPLELVPELLGHLGTLGEGPTAVRPVPATAVESALSREELDELLIVARWLRRLPRGSVIDLSAERLGTAAARRKAAAALATRICRLAAGA